MIALLADSGLLTLAVERVDLITGNEAKATFPLWVLPAVFGAVGLIALQTWAFVAYRSRVSGNDNEYAFRALARSLKLGRTQRNLVRKLALTHGAASPVGLLLSDHALKVALAGFESGTVSKREAAAVEGLRKSFGLAAV